MGISSYRGLAICSVLLGALSCGEFVGQDAAAITNGALSVREAVVAVGFQRANCELSLAPTCSGVVIGEAAVLTAAHCVKRKGARYEVFIGAAVAGEGSFYRVVEVMRHPGFDDETNANDLAWLVLERPVEVTAAVLPEMPLVDTAEGQLVTVAGFGLVASESDEQGQRLEGVSRINAVEGEVFTTESAPSMSCLGDSGGPIFQRETSAQNSGAHGSGMQGSGMQGSGMQGSGMQGGTRAASEVLLGITFEGDAACAKWGRAVNVGAYLDFVTPALVATSPDSQACQPVAPLEPTAPMPEAGCAVVALPAVSWGRSGTGWLISLSLVMAVIRRRRLVRAGAAAERAYAVAERADAVTERD